MFQKLINENLLLCSPKMWPDFLQLFLQKANRVIDGYFIEDREIDAQARENVILRINRPINDYFDEFIQVRSAFKQLIKDYQVICFHCTRLTDFEQNQVLMYGLNPLSPDLLLNRINKLYDINEIQRGTLDAILNDNCSSDENRQGLLFFFHGLETLKEESGVYELLNNWGGEACYRNHLESLKILQTLAKIGKPCIVIVLLPLQELSFLNDSDFHLLKIWHNRDGNTHQFDVDTHVNKTVKVETVIDVTNPLFWRLTGANSWHNKLSI